MISFRLLWGNRDHYGDDRMSWRVGCGPTHLRHREPQDAGLSRIMKWGKVPGTLVAD